MRVQPWTTFPPYAVRAPSAEELFSNGPHIATQSYEVGNPNLRREASWGAEASLRVNSEARTTHIKKKPRVSPGLPD